MNVPNSLPVSQPAPNIVDPNYTPEHGLQLKAIIAEWTNSNTSVSYDSSKAPTGNYIIQFTSDCKISESKTSFLNYMTLNYNVINQNDRVNIIGNYSSIVTWASPKGLYNLYDICKATWGMSGVKRLADEGKTPQQLAALFLMNHALKGNYAYVRVLNDPTNNWANHYWYVVDVQQPLLQPTGQQPPPSNQMPDPIL